MSINSIEAATAYSGELDKLFTQKSVTGFFADNIIGAKFVGAKTVMIPDIDFQGLANYDRDTGFSRGAITVANTPYTMSMDRARSLQIDREELDESGVAKLAGSILGEYVRTKVVPECDAYVISKLATVSSSRGCVVDGNPNAPYQTLVELINEVYAKAGYDSELVAFVESSVYAKLCNDKDVASMITLADFKQGEINTQVKSINGVALIPVPAERMRTKFTFYNNERGGFVASSGANHVYMLVCPKTSAHLVKKTEKMRVFTPEQNVDADAYKFDYRIYYDVFVRNSEMDTIWTWLGENGIFETTISTIYVEDGSTEIEAFAIYDDSGLENITYQWYTCDKYGENLVKIKGETAESLKVDTTKEKGTYYYITKIYCNGLYIRSSSVMTLIVE